MKKSSGQRKGYSSGRPADKPAATARPGGRDARPGSGGTPHARRPAGNGENAPEGNGRFKSGSGRKDDGQHGNRGGIGSRAAGHNPRPGRNSNEAARPGRPAPASAPEKQAFRKTKSFEKEEAHFHKEAPRRHAHRSEAEKPDALMTLNKYLAHSGTTGRREAAEIIKLGKVTVNGEVMLTPGYRVKPKDVVALEGKTLKPQHAFVYVLLNKPKGFITTTDDERGRRTVMELVQGAAPGRLFPVGRLDRNTTGVLLMTNDGDLAQKLSHPRYQSRKIYHVGLDKKLTQRDFDQIVAGVKLEDGIAVVDDLAYLETKDELGIEIHSGKNRIVRRIFESLGYEVIKLDRVIYAGLTKKNVPRGKWRHLNEQELVLLKHFKG